MEPFAILSLAAVAGVFVLLATNRFSPDVVLLGALAVLLVFGGEDFSAGAALSGFSNEGMLTVGVLFVVAAGVRDTGAIWVLANRFLGRPRDHRSAQIRLMAPVAAMSGFVNNTPLVAVLLPVVNDWARKLGLPLSRLLIPLSYAAILGGTCTLIGTSTNLLIMGELQEAMDYRLGFFEITKVGLPVVLVGVTFLFFAGIVLLPDRKPAMTKLQDPREYTLEMRVEPRSPLVGKTIEEAGLRHLPGVFLMEIDRDGEVIPSVSPRHRLMANDQLVFVGVVDSVVDLQKFPGLKIATDQVFKIKGDSNERELVEAVVSHTSPLIGKSIRESRFRTQYNGVVIAVARNGERIAGKIGSIVLEPGDTLLLETTSDFVDQYRDSREFYLVSRIEGYIPPKHDRAWMAMLVMAGLVIAVTSEWLTTLQAGVVAAGAMLLGRCVSLDSARRAVDARLLLTIAAALGVAEALNVSGAAEFIVLQMLNLTSVLTNLGLSLPMAALILLYVTAVVASELLTNTAAAALMFPFAMQFAGTLEVDYMPFVIAIMIASSAAFATPIGYQTNLMVYGPGGYKFGDFLRIGVPMDIIVGITAIAVIPFAFPFSG